MIRKGREEKNKGKIERRKGERRFFPLTKDKRRANNGDAFSQARMTLHLFTALNEAQRGGVDEVGGGLKRERREEG